MTGDDDFDIGGQPVGDGPRPNPFPGPLAYTQRDEAYFFGREDEIEELVSLVLSTSIVLLYAPSGTGKSSIIQAGLSPVLEKEFNFTVLPPVHIGTGARTDTRDGDTNPFSYAVRESIMAAAGDEDFPADIASAIQQTQSSAPGQSLLVLDQFEEIFNDPALWQEREAFLKEISAVLEQDSRLRVIIALRSDYLADLVPYERLLPGHLAVRYQLDHLDEHQATKAIRAAFQASGVTLPESTLSSRMDLLLEDRQGRPIRATRVNAIQLQIVFRRLWAELRNQVETRRGRNSAAKIKASVRNSMSQYVDEAIAEAALKARGDEAFIRWWLRSQLITSTGRRAFALVEDKQTAGLSNDVLDELAKVRLVQLEQRHGSRLAELTHDSMVDAVRDSNDLWLRSRRTVRRRTTAILLAVMIALLSVAPLLLADSASTLLSIEGSTKDGKATIPIASREPGVVVEAYLYPTAGTAVMEVVELLDNDEKTTVGRADGRTDEVRLVLAVETRKSKRYAVVLTSTNGTPDFSFSLRVDPIKIERAKEHVELKSSEPQVGLALPADVPYLITTTEASFDVEGADVAVLGQGFRWAIIKATHRSAVATLLLNSTAPGQRLRATVFEVTQVNNSFEIKPGKPVQVAIEQFAVLKFVADESGAPLGVEGNCQHEVDATALDDHSIFTPSQDAGDEFVRLEPGLVLPLNVMPGSHQLSLTGTDGAGCKLELRKYSQKVLSKYGAVQAVLGPAENAAAYAFKFRTDSVVVSRRSDSMTVRVLCSNVRDLAVGSRQPLQDDDQILEYVPADNGCVLWLLRTKTGAKRETAPPLWITQAGPDRVG